MLSRFGGKISYSYADSNFEFEGQHGGDGVSVSVEQATGEATETALIGILPPANLFGWSKHMSSAQLYWDNNRLSIQATYKLRSQYFQQYTRDIQRRIRYTDDNMLQALSYGSRFFLGAQYKFQ